MRRRFIIFAFALVFLFASVETGFAETNAGVFRSGTWFLDINGNGTWDGQYTDSKLRFGGFAQDIPITGDWDGTGTARAGIYRDGTWFLDINGDGTWDGQPTDRKLRFGGFAGDIPVTGDWDGTGTTRIGIYRDGTWFLDINGNGIWDGQPTDKKYRFGGFAEDIPITGEWDGTGTTRIGIYRDGTWFLDINGNGAWDGQPTDRKFRFGGLPGDMPVTGMWTVSATEVSGLISSDTTWSLSGSPYIVTGGVLVAGGVTLTIEPGVTVKFQSGKAMQINGTLIAKGTAAKKIIFTSYESSPAPGDWGYILFSDSSADAVFDGDGNYAGGSIIEYVTVEYSGGAAVANNGAVRLDNAHPFVSHATIRNNADSGIYAWNLSGHLRVLDSIITNNASSGSGGGILVSGGTVTISRCTISDNTSVSDGGGINVYIPAGTFTITDSTISNNATNSVVGWHSYNGGGIAASGTGTISNNTVTGNEGGGGGGMIVSGAVSVTKNIVADNVADSGGGIYSYYNNGDVSSNAVSNNTAANVGGGIAAYSGTVVISGNSISDNTATNGGGGIHSDAAATISNNSITGNSALNAPAVEYFHYDGQNVRYNTIEGNQATGSEPTRAVFVNLHPLFNYNNLFGNSATYGLWNDNAQGTADVDATNNWWGTSSASGVDAAIYDWFDDAAKGIVDYSPHATSIRTDTPISPPAGLTAAAGAGSITLSWTANPESDTAGYIVYWDTDAGHPYQNSVDVGNVTCYTITGLDAATYHVTVTAYDTGYDAANDDPATIVNENQANGNESWYAGEKEVALLASSDGKAPVVSSRLAEIAWSPFLVDLPGDLSRHAGQKGRVAFLFKWPLPVTTLAGAGRHAEDVSIFVE